MIDSFLQQGEGSTIEFKISKEQLPKNVFETVCAFLNHRGGHILLGVKDNGAVVGVQPESVSKLQEDFANLSNDPGVINPPFLLESEVVESDGKKVIVIPVPSSSQVHQCKGKYYNRSADGDFVVRSQVKIAELFSNKSNLFTENIIYPYLNESHFEDGVVEKLRRLIRLNRRNHPWLKLDGIPFFRAMGLYRTDLMNNEEGFTLAALLLLGKEEVIAGNLPYFKIEALVRKQDIERYDDRLMLQTNLITAYERLMDFVEKHLSDKFYMEGVQRISLRDHLFREVIANFLIHREYINPRVSTFEIFEDRCVFRNANKPQFYGEIFPGMSEAFPKNPRIAKIFVQLGRAEELGTGIAKIFKYGKLFSGVIPQIKDADLFEVVLPLYEKVSSDSMVKEPRVEYGVSTHREKQQPKDNVFFSLDYHPTATEKKLLRTLIENPAYTAEDLAEIMQMSDNGIWYYIKKLRKKGVIKRIGANKNGKWKVMLAVE